MRRRDDKEVDAPDFSLINWTIFKNANLVFPHLLTGEGLNDGCLIFIIKLLELLVI